MNKPLTLMQTLTVAVIAVGSMSTANAGVFFRTRVVLAPVVAPVVVAPVVTPVYVPTCRLVSVPVVNALTGVTFLVPRRVCN